MNWLTTPRLRRILLALCVFLLIASICVQPALRAQSPLRVAAAADLEPVLPPVLDEFQRATGIHSEDTYQASAMLTTQIENGAPFDLFLSADLGYPKRLIGDGLADAAGSADSSTPITYAKGTLVLWARNDSHQPPPTLDLLRGPLLKRLAIANPDRAPYGRAAVAALTSLNLYESLKPRLLHRRKHIPGCAVRRLRQRRCGPHLTHFSTHAAPPEPSGSLPFPVIPRNLYPPIEQGAVIVSNTKQRAAAHKLLDFMLSPPVQAELARLGLTPVK